MPDLRTVRTAAGLSQSQAARLLGVSVRTLQDWEAGQASTARMLATRLLAILTRQERLPRRVARVVATPTPPNDSAAVSVSSSNTSEPS